MGSQKKVTGLGVIIKMLIIRSIAKHLVDGYHSRFRFPTTHHAAHPSHPEYQYHPLNLTPKLPRVPVPIVEGCSGFKNNFLRLLEISIWLFLKHTLFEKRFYILNNMWAPLVPQQKHLRLYLGKHLSQVITPVCFSLEKSELVAGSKPCLSS